MKYLKLYEQFRRILENKNSVPCILVDGTSSAGKSYFSNFLVQSGWVIIGMDEFVSGEIPTTEKEKIRALRRLPFDHEQIGVNLEAALQWHKRMIEIGSSKNILSPNITNPKHPKRQEWKSKNNVLPMNWYMYQDYLYGEGLDRNFYYKLYNDPTNKTSVDELIKLGFPCDKIKDLGSSQVTGVIFDDVTDGIKKFIPECKHILLYTPLEKLFTNLQKRNESGDPSDFRTPDMILSQFAGKYQAVTSKSKLDPIETGYTKELIIKLFSDNSQSIPDYLNNFFEEIGIEDSEYWFEVRESVDITPISIRKGTKLLLDTNNNWNINLIKSPQSFLTPEEFASKISEI